MGWTKPVKTKLFTEYDNIKYVLGIELRGIVRIYIYVYTYIYVYIIGVRSSTKVQSTTILLAYQGSAKGDLWVCIVLWQVHLRQWLLKCRYFALQIVRNDFTVNVLPSGGYGAWYLFVLDEVFNTIKLHDA